uniref:Uncharacterized protein n=1 Tax=Panagrolaimus sp. JU765 TaxID=591449 RepID=A0AC34Q184_9BILA
MMENLPHFPPEIEFDSYGFANGCSSFLKIMTKKSQHQPIKRLYIEDFVELEDLQTFLQTAKFMKDAEIYCQIMIEDDELRIFITFVDGDSFEIEVFSSSKMALIYLLDVKNKYTLSFRVYDSKNRHNGFIVPTNERFNLTTASCPTQSIFSGIFTPFKRDYVVENIVENEWIKINFESTNPRLFTHYSSQLLKNWFPRNENETPLERINKINDILGCKKTLVEPKLLKDTIDNFWENFQKPLVEPDKLDMSDLLHLHHVSHP